MLYCDNLSAVYLTANPAFHARTKHFAKHYHYVRERVALKALVVTHVRSSHQTADILTKSLPLASFTRLRTKLGVELPPTQSLQGSISKQQQPNAAVFASIHRPNVKPKPIKSMKQVWIQRCQRSSSPPVNEDKSRDKPELRNHKPESSRVRTEIELSNRFLALDDDCSI